MDFEKELRELQKRYEDEKLREAEALARQQYEAQKQQPIIQKVQPLPQYTPLQMQMAEQGDIHRKETFMPKQNKLAIFSFGLSIFNTVLWLVFLVFLSTR